MNPPNQITFTIKQHTPLIHFQHEQDGATLRATELKPAFDKYLWEKVFKNDIDTYQKFLITPNKFNDGDRALDYKITIDSSEADIWASPIERPKIRFDKSTNRETISGSEQFPCFFGNMGDVIGKQFSIANGNIYITFKTFRTDLLIFLRTHFVGFIERKNFGTRQSKGFGAFWVANQGVALGVNKFKFKCDVTINEARALKNHKFRYPQNTLADDQILQLERFWQVFKQIELFWKIVRAGYNVGQGNYVKAPLVFYMSEHFDKNKSYNWDKKNIKEAYKNNNPPNQDNNLLVRDLFGLATDSEWKSDGVNLKKVETTNEIERYKSPVTFKPKWNPNSKTYDVFIFLNPVDKDFLNKSFRIEWKVRGQTKNNLILRTPQSFGMSKYFKFLIGDYKDNILHEYISRTSNADLKTIEKVFDNLIEYNNPTS